MARLAALAVLFAVLCASHGVAQQPPCGEPEAESETTEPEGEPLGENEEQARRLFLLGDDLYMQGRYAEALAAFEESYELSGRALLLYNMANVHERSGDFEQALLKLEAYLPDSTDEERPRLRTRIESLRDRIERIEERRRLEEERLRLQGGNPQPDEPMNVPALVTTLGGALLLGGGIGLAMLARNAGSELDEGCSTTDSGTFCPTDLESQVKRERRAAISADGLFVAGAIAIGVGIYLFLRDDPEDDDETDGELEPQLDAWLGPQGGGMQVSGAF
ncbi:MAG: tetratricopeptide repeat protein [Deltaproteobacteria bacterium]|nr:tetratricopeptide repeat protein [Deltaproteobacteria bacterium]